MPIPGPEMTNESRLNNAINEVSKEVLVTLAQTLCKENTSAKEFFEKNLFVSEDQVPRPDAEDKDEAPATTDGAKISRPRYADCTNCEKEFDVSKNSSTSCSYHPGMFFSLMECFTSLFEIYVAIHR